MMLALVCALVLSAPQEASSGQAEADSRAELYEQVFARDPRELGPGAREDPQPAVSIGRAAAGGEREPALERDAQLLVEPPQALAPERPPAAPRRRERDGQEDGEEDDESDRHMPPGPPPGMPPG